MIKSILIVSHEYSPFIGGVATEVKEIVNLISNYFKIFIITVTDKDKTYVSKENNVTIVRIKVPFLTEFKDATYLSLIFFMIKSFFYSFRIMKKYDISIIHGVYLFPSGFIALILSKIFKTKSSATVIGAEVYDPSSKRKIYNNKFYKIILKFIIKNIHSIIAHSTDIVKRTEKYCKEKPEKFKIIPLGIHKNPKIKIKLRKIDNFLIICSLSRLEERKGIDLTLNALKKLSDKKINFVYHVMGDGKKRKELEGLCKQLNIEKKVIFHGFVTEKEKENILTKSHIFILPSYHEGFGIVFLEAMQYGLPIITTNTGGHTDFIIHERNGFIINKRDPNLIVKYIEKIIYEPQVFEIIQKNNLMDIKNFYWENLKKHYINFFKKLQ